MENWKSIPGYEGLYEVSDLGNVKRLPGIKGARLKDVAICKNPDGYLVVHLWKQNTRKCRKVHRLVLLAFYGESKLHCNHKDGNKHNNCIENLEYVTRSQNERHKIDVLKRWGGPTGAKGWRAKIPPLNEINRMISLGMSNNAIAKYLGYPCPKIIGVVRRGEHWTQRMCPI